MVNFSRVRTLLEMNFDIVRSEPVEWLLLLGNRLLIAGLMTVCFALATAALMSTNFVILTDNARMIFLAQGLLTASVTLITIVLAINQLVLSQEFRSPGQLHDHIQNVISYRDRVEETTNQPTVPTTPADFLTVLLDGARSTAQQVGGSVKGEDHDQFVEEIDALVTTITAQTDEISDVLARSEQSLFNTLAASLETNFSEQLHEARRLQTVYENELPGPTRELLDDLIDSLKLVDIARQYFKSLYIQSELARLSRLLLYLGLPMIASTIFLYLISVGDPGAAMERDLLPWIVLLVVTLSFGLVAVLFSYVLRIAMVAQRTVAITPFSTPTQESIAEMTDSEDEEP